MAMRWPPTRVAHSLSQGLACTMSLMDQDTAVQIATQTTTRTINVVISLGKTLAQQPSYCGSGRPIKRVKGYQQTMHDSSASQGYNHYQLHSIMDSAPRICVLTHLLSSVGMKTLTWRSLCLCLSGAGGGSASRGWQTVQLCSTG